MAELDNKEQRLAEEEQRRREAELAALAAEAERRAREAAEEGADASRPAPAPPSDASAGGQTQPAPTPGAASGASTQGAAAAKVTTAAGSGTVPQDLPPAPEQAAEVKKSQAAAAEKGAERRAREAREVAARQARAAEEKKVEALISQHRASHSRARIAWAAVYYLLSSLSVLFAIATVVVLDLDSVKDAALKKDWATGLATAAAVAVILSLWLRHGQNARRHAAALPRLDSLSVDLTKPEADLDEIRAELTAIINEQGGEMP